MNSNEKDHQKAAVRDEFSVKIGRLTKSRAFLDVCEEVYGYRTYLFNMMDKEQIDYVLQRIPITERDRVLDLGCGNGSMLRLITEQYRCMGIGIDLLDTELVECDDERMQYICGDIDEISLDEVQPTIILSVDSLYFSCDMCQLVKRLCQTKNNRIYLFYSQYLFDSEHADKESLRSEKTDLAKALQAGEISFDTINFGKNEQQLYLRMEEFLIRHREDFVAEGNEDLYEQKLSETRMGTQLYEQGSASRYLYIV